MTEALLSAYRNYGILTNKQARSIVAKELGEVNNKYFYHLLRGTQQGLKRQGLISNIAKGVWSC